MARRGERGASMFYAVHGENSHNCSWNFTNNRRARKQKAQSKQKSEKEMKTKSTERGVQMSLVLDWLNTLY